MQNSQRICTIGLQVLNFLSVSQSSKVILSQRKADLEDGNLQNIETSTKILN